MAAGPIKNFSDLAITVTSGWVIEEVGGDCTGILGYQPQQLAGRGFLDFLSADSLEAVQAVFEEVAKGVAGEAQFFLYRSLSESGSWLHFQAIVQRSSSEPLRLRIDARDVTEQANLDQMRMLRDRALTATSNAFVISDVNLPDMPIIYVNPAFERVSGYSAAEVLGRNCRFLQGADRNQPGVVELRKAIRDQRPCRVVLRNYQKDGTLFWNDLALTPIFDTKGELTHYLGIQSEISQSKLLEEKLSHNAFHDGLTDLPNRLLFMQKLDQASRHVARTPGCTFAVLLLDIVKFKVVNNSLGQAAGDKLLNHVADCLVRCMRDIDTVARLGGDEFVILAEEITGSEQAMQIGERVMAALSEPVVIEGHELRINVSLGIALFAGSMKAQDCLNNAGAARFSAKQGGSTRCVLFDGAVIEDPGNRLQLENEIRTGIQQAEFCPFYQPIIDLGSGSISRFEALVRWNHPTRGLLAPAHFLPVAEDSDLIVNIGRSVFSQVCRDIRQWLPNLNDPNDLSVNFNLSGREFSQPNLLNWLTDALLQHKIPTSCLHIEITEGVVMELPDTSRLKLRKLRDLGIHVHIDDFGTGHSSLSRLQHFPLDCLKIDKSFVENIEDDRTSAEIVRSITAMAHTLGLSVVAEGVETEGQAEILRQFGCEYGQGYHFGRPMPAAAILDLLKKEAVLGVRS
ncbi:MAG TPA: EAL domain-containing protein [Acidisarcina sp.]